MNPLKQCNITSAPANPAGRLWRADVWLLLILLLSACGGGGGGGGGGPPEMNPPPEEPQVFGLLKPAQSEQELAATLRQGLSGSAHIGGGPVPALLTEGPAAAEVAADGSGFSTTNLQETGVDEGDIVKYDGEILYILEREFFSGPQPLAEPIATGAIFAPEPVPASIRLLRTDPEQPASMELARISLDVGAGIENLYLADGVNGRQLVGVGQSNPFVYWEMFAADYFWRDGSSTVQVWNVDDPAAPEPDWTLELDGGLLASRRIDNMLYLVTRYTPTVEGLIAYPADEAQIEANRELIENTALADLLPDYQRDGGSAEELLVSSDCYLPNEDYEELTAPVPGGSLIIVTAIDLDAPDAINAVCLNAQVSGFYASRNSLYVTGYSGDGSTLVHKVRLAGGAPAYHGSGEVPGYIGTANPSFLMSEQGEDLRVVSSLQSADEELGRHRLTILRESADNLSLQQIAQLPNSSQPANLGKPGEDIFAARFLGDRAYVVTFQIIDPLYVIDLSRPDQPQIAGELELPGFSTLLQPLGESLLLGVGNDVPVDARGLVQGVKVALFDVSDISAPLELGSTVIGKRGSYSPALGDYHALTLLDTGSGYRAAITVVRHEEPVAQGVDMSDPAYWYAWSDSGLYEFGIDTASGELQLEGKLIVEQRTPDKQWPEYDSYRSRSVLHDDAVFYVLGGKVWTHHWGTASP